MKIIKTIIGVLLFVITVVMNTMVEDIVGNFFMSFLSICVLTYIVGIWKKKDSEK